MQDFKKQKGLKFTHLNIWSLWKYFDELRILLTENHIHCATFSETWLNDQMPTSMKNVPNYITYRLDRKVINNDGHVKIGGGICAYILSYIEVDVNIYSEYCRSDLHIEIQGLLLKPHNHVYCLPNSNANTFNEGFLTLT